MTGVDVPLCRSGAAGFLIDPIALCRIELPFASGAGDQISKQDPPLPECVCTAAQYAPTERPWPEGPTLVFGRPMANFLPRER